MQKSGIKFINRARRRIAWRHSFRTISAPSQLYHVGEFKQVSSMTYVALNPVKGLKQKSTINIVYNVSLR